jgi:tetratricopeptide (TPR) repeat protein
MAWHNKGVSLFKMDRYNEAIVAFDQALTLAAEDRIDSLYSKGVALGLLAQHEQALAAFEQVIRIDANHGMAWHNIGIALLKLERSEEAEAAFARARMIGAEPDGDLQGAVPIKDKGHYHI